MKLCVGQCRYLITMHHLNSKLKVVRSVDIAKALAVTRPSVSRMLKCMAKLELIKPDYSLCVEFTEKGRETAMKLSENFDDVHAFFKDILKLDEESAYEQSVQFLASFPQQTVERISVVTHNTLEKRNKK